MAADGDEVADVKGAVRRRVWRLLDEQGVVHGQAEGRIPNFVGAQAAADRLAQHPAWRNAHVVKAVPDRAQLPVRARAIAEGKLVYMAVPMLAGDLPFYLLDPRTLPVAPEQAASREWAADHALQVGPDQMEPLDLVVCGSVAVNRDGVRIGKGAGYTDIEVGLLQEAGLLPVHAVIATTVHPLQVVDGSLPETRHDFSVDLVVTPDELIECGPGKRPSGILWEDLEPRTIDAIPWLAARSGQRSVPHKPPASGDPGLL